MTKQSITVELDSQTALDLAALGTLNDVLEQLARTTADSMRNPPQVVVPDAPASSRSVLVDQREANEHLVRAAIRAQELGDEAAAAQERAEESEHELRTVAEFRELFIGILGHDLRNPLSSIIMAGTAVLKRGNLELRDAEAVKRIVRNGQRIARMSTQLLDLTQARLGGGLTVTPTETDMAELCRNIVSEFETKDICLEIHGDLKGSWDPDRVAQVLSNLVGNAIEYAAEETSVSIDARSDGPDVVVEVRNAGASIPPDVLPHIFEPFRRARPRETLVTGNLGLGLYIANQIVLAHGGTLGASSSANATTFAMRLPRARAPNAPPSAEGAFTSH